MTKKEMKINKNYESEKEIILMFGAIGIGFGGLIGSLYALNSTATFIQGAFIIILGAIMNSISAMIIVACGISLLKLLANTFLAIYKTKEGKKVLENPIVIGILLFIACEGTFIVAGLIPYFTTGTTIFLVMIPLIGNTALVVGFIKDWWDDSHNIIASGA